MAVTINITNGSTGSSTSEFFAAKDLRVLLQSPFSSSVNGEIIIVPNATLVGQEPRNVDLLVAGQLEGCVLPEFYTNDRKYEKKDLCVDGFCVAIELKQHDEKDIKTIDSHVYVSYHGDWKDVTEKSKQQRNSVVICFQNRFNYAPYVTDFIWFNNISAEQLQQLGDAKTICAMPAKFDFKEFVGMLIQQGARCEYDSDDENLYHMRGSYGGENFLEDFKALFSS